MTVFMTTEFKSRTALWKMFKTKHCHKRHLQGFRK